ncbi:MAG: hypothetical protein V4581_08705 [Bacteroidota bacterium]
MKYLNNLFLSLMLIALISCSDDNQKNVNVSASVQRSDELPENPLLMIPLTSSVSPKNKTMSTLYGNSIARDHAQKDADLQYPEGTILYEVTWHQQADEFWFGANIPKEIKCVERVSVDDDTFHYQIFKGKPLKKVVSENDSLRMNYITSQKMAFTP